MFFVAYLNKLKDSRRKAIQSKLNQMVGGSSIDQQLVHNIYAESRLNQKDWEELIRLVELPGTNRNNFEEIMKGFCRNHCGLNRNRAKVKVTTVFGRAVSFDKLCEMLYKESDEFDSFEEVQDYLLELILTPLSDTPDLWKSFEIGKHIMWGAFDSNGGRPFGNPLPDRESLICSLGILRMDPPVVIFEYRLPKEIKPCIPTICHAYASEQWSPYFRPALPRESYGITMPTDTCSRKVGRPEVVHCVIKAKNLVEPLEFAQ